MAEKRKYDKTNHMKHNSKRHGKLCTNISINSSYFDATFKNDISKAFIERRSIEFDNGAKIISEPFTCAILPNFIQPDEYLHDLKSELFQLEMEENSCDLYKFKQSKDFRSYSDNPIINQFSELLSKEFRVWMSNVSKTTLLPLFDSSCSIYECTDFLLCHDDRLAHRKIAFIFYLVPEWKKDDGGTLDLFSSNSNSPVDVCTSIVPEWNSLVFFEVSPHSYHQVSEILSNKSRVSISGWFHGNSVERTLSNESEIFSIRKGDLMPWINPMYLVDETMVQIRSTFESDSEIELHNFIEEEIYNIICEELMSSKIVWTKKGPPNRGHYEEATSEETYPPTVKKFMEFLSSPVFSNLLINLTGLKFFGTSCHSKGCSTIRRWSHRSYSLLFEGDDKDCYLDSIIYFNCSGYEPEYGGVTTYFDKEEDETLLTVEPKHNSLALVYITSGTSKFVKYVNSNISNKISVPFFHDIITTYVDTTSVENCQIP